MVTFNTKAKIFIYELTDEEREYKKFVNFASTVMLDIYKEELNENGYLAEYIFEEE